MPHHLPIHTPGTAPSKGLILFAHGSRDPQWTSSCERIADLVAEALSPTPVALAYLQMVGPTLIEGLESLEASNLQPNLGRILVLPLFLASGGHMRKDVPEAIEALRGHRPELDIVCLSAIGEDRRFAELIVDRSRSALLEDSP